MRRLSSAFMALLVIVLSIGVEAQSEEFVPYIPDPSQVRLTHWEHSGISYMNITLEFPDTGFNISSWGTPVATIDNISVDAEIWRYTGLSFPVVTAVSHTYTLGALPCGEYDFLFKVWEYSVRNATFVVSLEIIVPDDYSSIQEAIDAASEGDTVFVRDGTYYESIRINKSINLIGESRENTVVDWGAGGNVIHVSRNSVNITGFTVIGGISVQWVGVKLANVSNCHISNINVSSEFYGIVLSNSTSNTIEDSTCVLDNYYHSLTLMDHSNNNTVRDSIFSADFGTAIYIGGASRDNMIIDNLCTKSRFGIWMSNAMDNKIVNNTINLNHQYGIFVRSSYSNTIYGNCISSRWTVHGIHFDPLFPSEGNVIYGNCFANRRGQAYANGSLNVWDNNLPSGGNFWRNYNGTDLDNDGIGDSPYMIDENNTDHYPLMKPLFWWNNADVNHDFNVDIYDIVDISDAYLSTPSDPDWNVHCDVTEPYGIVDIYDVVLMCASYGEKYTP